MLKIVIPGQEYFDSDIEEFVTFDETVLEFEHSLVSLSKWESKFEKPFLNQDNKSSEEALGYIEAMIMTPDYPPDILDKLTQANVDEINEYINKKMTATTFRELPGGGNTGELITSELIYFWMSSYKIPVDHETWHLSRLFTLIKVFAAKNGKQKKMSRSEVAARNRMLNAQRREQHQTAG